MTQGSGEPALTIAKAVPTCSVVATDLAPGMVEAAQRRGADEGVENFRSGGCVHCMRCLRCCERHAYALHCRSWFWQQICSAADDALLHMMWCMCRVANVHAA